MTDEPDDRTQPVSRPEDTRPWDPKTGGQPPTPPAPPPPPPPEPAVPPAPPSYAAPPPYGAPPSGPPSAYGSPPYGAPPPYASPGQVGSPASAEADSIRNQAIASLILNIVSVLACCGLGLVSIAGAIVAGIGMSRTGTDVVEARRLVKISWWLLAANFILLVIVLIGLFALGVASEMQTSP